MAWAPLLDGELAARAWRAIEDIADALENHELQLPDIGSAVLFWAYLSSAREQPRYEAAFERVFDQLAARLSQPFERISIVSGLANVGFAAEHVMDRDDGDGDPLAHADDALLEAMSEERWRGKFSLLGGLCGYGVYFCERLSGEHRPESAERGLSRVIEHLAAMSSKQPGGIAWFSEPHMLPLWQPDPDAPGNFNVGMAHGIGGVVGLLGRAVSVLDSPTARELLDGAVAWLLASAAPDHDDNDTGGQFPNVVGLDGVPTFGRHAWCYGDYGLSLALLGAGRRAGEPAWIAQANGVLDHCAAGLATDNVIVDVPLCHGAAGLGHMFNRAQQVSGSAAQRQAAERWFERALAGQHPERAIAGFPFYRPDYATGGPASFAPEVNYLEGVTGVGLALLAAVSPDEPNWDRLLFMDL